MSMAKAAVHLSLTGLLVFASGCSKHRAPRLDGSVDPIMRDASAVPCDFGSGDGGACRGAAQLEVDICDRAWVEVTPEPGILGREVLVRARSKDIDRYGLNVAWMSEPDGKFGDADEASTTFHCESLGRKMLHLTAVDGRGCSSEVDVELNCAPAVPSKQSPDAGTP